MCGFAVEHLQLQERLLIELRCLMCRLLIAVLFCSFAGLSFAQQSPQAPAPPSGSEPEKKIEKKEESRRMLGVLPQFAVTSRQNAPPLSPKEKFHLFAKSAFDPVTLGTVGFQAAISQATDEFPAYGQGAAGYGKRYGASLADSRDGKTSAASAV